MEMVFSFIAGLLNSKFRVGAVVGIGCGFTDYRRGGVAEIADDLASLICGVQERRRRVAAAARAGFTVLAGGAGTAPHPRAAHSARPGNSRTDAGGPRPPAAAAVFRSP